MNQEETYIFYKNQFDMFKEVLDLSNLEVAWAEEIIEQIGKPFTTVLELGAGNGLLARTLSTYGKKITTLELVADMVEFAKALNDPSITALCGSFYDIELPETFDAILYIDGFGVGGDEDQLLLLKRIHHWLNDDGVALIDIYHPNYWKKVSGREMTPVGDSGILRVYGYDQLRDRMTDTWWTVNCPEEKFQQSLACYRPDEIDKLCKEAGLDIVAYFPGGAMDFEAWQYHETVSLSECLSYRIKVKKT